tara:strand:- start:6009 stop:6779 length:771 start_codon:yes stop_codon:yes gene_type:complete
MLELTKNIFDELNKIDSIEERLTCIKDRYKNKKAVLLAPGPSLTDHDSDRMNSIFSDRDDLVVFAIKQSYDITNDNTDFHIMNPWNIDRKNPYKYSGNTIAFWGIANSFLQAHMDIIHDNKHRCNLWLPVLNPPTINDRDTIQATCNFDRWKNIEQSLVLYWGKSILYSTALPLILHLGIKDIVTMGWDFKINKGNRTGHFYDSLDDVIITDENEMINSTEKLYDWCLENKINIKILSDLNPADDRFYRINSIEEI